MLNGVAEQRRDALAARRGLSARQRIRSSRAACLRLARLPAFRHARDIALYWPLASEADPRPLLDHMSRSQRAHLPRVCGGGLGFVVIGDRDFRGARSALGMLEPCDGRARGVRAMDLLVLPLAAFDAAGHRIGMGGGFYDRTLARRAGWRPRLIGLAFEAQRLPAIEPQPWDVDLDGIVTEAAVHRRAARALR